VIFGKHYISGCRLDAAFPAAIRCARKSVNGDFVSLGKPIRNTLHAALISLLVVLTGCATPPAKEPRGKWMPVNRLSEVTHAIPLHQSYLYQVSPVDGTLKGLLTRWAKDSGMTLSYMHPNDYTLYAPVGNIRTNSSAEAVAALTAAYAAQNVHIAIDKTRIVVSVAGSAAPVAGASAGAAAAVSGE